MADNLFTICEPRPDVLQGVLRESDFAADLSQVLRGDAPDEYKLPGLFFSNTYPTKGLKNVLKLVALRVLGRPCLLYTSPSPRDGLLSRMPSSA